LTPYRPVGIVVAERPDDASLQRTTIRENQTSRRISQRHPSKEALAIAAADYWSETTSALFAEAPYHAHADALDRVLGYIDFRKALLKGSVPEFSCLVGTLVQEVYDTHPAIRAAVDRSISEHAARIETDIAEAMRERGVEGSASSLALHTQAVIQGAFILAKAKGGAEVAADSIDHLRRYVELLFAGAAVMKGTR